MIRGLKSDWRLVLGLFATSLVAVVVGTVILEKGGYINGIWKRSPKEVEQIYFNATARMSEGEQLILARDRNPFKEAGILAYRNENYGEAIHFFQNALRFHRDPETLIYLNNARVSQDGDFLTIAVTVTLDDDFETNLAQEILQGVAQAQKEFIEEGNNLKVIIGDDDNDPGSAVKLAQKFIDRPEILGVIGHYSSDLSLKAGALYQAEKLVMITPTAASTAISDIGDFIFRTGPTNLDTSEAITEHLVDKKQVSKVGVFYSSTSPYSSQLQELVVEKFEQELSKKTISIDADHPDFDIEAAFTTLQEQNIEAIAILLDRLATPHSVAIVTKNDQALRMISGDDAIYSDWTSETEAKASLGLVVPVPWHALTNPSALFPVDSRELWGSDVSWRTAVSYDAAQALFNAFREAATNERKAIQAILADPNFVTQGAADSIRFSETGDRRHSITMVEVVEDDRGYFGYDFVPIDYERNPQNEW
ncbi:amino acid/amide ABC transporter substrate-binding protein, HAAT family [[Leptolyngbya] sp. PCC 7376]|uniref:ABC transporter substrate-binding protein n=1 Tax=[Leptolyngbya] sp. PCC 7376 TaxID=111781 RepID=UPI00029F248C|nr:ABC transporter substrate-binding protein [[Leptolyngbya] sp. PCC 7376]AFY37084.1 amino acid/amide ABC transporter substrate-binding protein, HAAT family [[Leptolyngbya] sp. PCC 7376]